MAATLCGLHATIDPTDGHSTVAKAVAHAGYNANLKYLLVVLDNVYGRQDLEALQPHLAGMKDALPAADLTGLIIAVRGDAADTGDQHGGQQDGYHFFSRFFAPWVGIPEDPVTGSAHAVLGPYWSQALGGTTSMKARQCSVRGGDVWVDMQAEAGRVVISGEAVVVMRGVADYTL
eukprot:GHRR01007080.1.p1 GENE.GHRR01007080.1~~GHRR01007080.1.p1  ORF type:complete len:176 (+),score=48.64 GHRR01007080.1:982-1509(+)